MCTCWLSCPTLVFSGWFFSLKHLRILFHKYQARHTEELTALRDESMSPNWRIDNILLFLLFFTPRLLFCWVWVWLLWVELEAKLSQVWPSKVNLMFFIYMLMIIVMCQNDTGLCSKVIFTWIQQSEIKVCLKDSAVCGFRIRWIWAWLLLLVGVLAEIVALIHETNSEKWKWGKKKGRKASLSTKWVCVTLTFMILEKRFQDSFLRELRLLRPVWLVQRRLIYVQYFCINRRTAGAERWSESGHLFYCCFFFQY